jgi:hypothetical protein
MPVERTAQTKVPSRLASRASTACQQLSVSATVGNST